MILNLLMALTLSWDAPTEREDGTPLPNEEISGYEVLLNGQSYILTPELELNITEKGTYTVKCIDTDGLKSEHSEAISVKGKPLAPGQVRKNK